MELGKTAPRSSRARHLRLGGCEHNHPGMRHNLSCVCMQVFSSFYDCNCHDNLLKHFKVQVFKIVFFRENTFSPQNNIDTSDPEKGNNKAVDPRGNVSIMRTLCQTKDIISNHPTCKRINIAPSAWNAQLLYFEYSISDLIILLCYHPLIPHILVRIINHICCPTC